MQWLSGLIQFIDELWLLALFTFQRKSSVRIHDHDLILWSARCDTFTPLLGYPTTPQPPSFLIPRHGICSIWTNDWNTPSRDWFSNCNLKCRQGGVALECQAFYKCSSGVWSWLQRHLVIFTSCVIYNLEASTLRPAYHLIHRKLRKIISLGIIFI